MVLLELKRIHRFLAWSAEREDYFLDHPAWVGIPTVHDWPLLQVSSLQNIFFPGKAFFSFFLFPRRKICEKKTKWVGGRERSILHHISHISPLTEKEKNKYALFNVMRAQRGKEKNVFPSKTEDS